MVYGSGFRFHTVQQANDNLDQHFDFETFWCVSTISVRLGELKPAKSEKPLQPLESINKNSAQTPQNDFSLQKNCKSIFTKF